MVRKHNQEFVKAKVEKRGYKLLNEYVNANTELILKDTEGYLYITTWNHFNEGHEPRMIYTSNPYSTQNIQHYLDLHLKGYKLLSTEYKGHNSKLKFRCDKGHEFTATWDNISCGIKCKECTCIATTDPWMVKYFVNKEDAYTHSHGSNDKVKVKCIDCGKEKEIRIYNICKYKGIYCNNCGDGYSFPEKFTMELLNQLNIKYVTQLSKTSFGWCDKYKYDFYLPDYNCIIETHGIQHYEQSARGRTLQEEQENDKYKKQLAEQNGFMYIELDCRKSELEYIKNSILNSELNNLFDLSKIDWLKCEEFALSNRVKRVCSYWREHNEINNENLTTSDVGNIFNLERSTICIYLKKGTKLGWCNYDGKEAKSKASSKVGKSKGKPVEVFKYGESLGIFESCSELDRQSEKLFGVKLDFRLISKVCRDEKPQYKGYTFKYITKEEYEERIKQIKNNC